ncbi:MAG: hypothetical protein WD267_10730 [Balneolales bacterium]
MNYDKRNKILTIGMAVVIVFLSWFLVESIRGPYQEVLEVREVTEQTRQRMINVRDALIAYERTHESFPENLDSLVEFLKTNERMRNEGPELFQERPPHTYNPDSIIYSPRSGERFNYTLVDTIRPNIYLLEDPNTEDHIGDLERTTNLNATSWN